MTKDLLKNITTIFSMLEELKKVSWQRCPPPWSHKSELWTDFTVTVAGVLQWHSGTRWRQHPPHGWGACWAALHSCCRVSTVSLLKSSREEREAEKHTSFYVCVNFHTLLLCCRLLDHTINSTELLSAPHRGSYNRIINVIGEAEMAANQSREAADQAYKVTQLNVKGDKGTVHVVFWLFFNVGLVCWARERSIKSLMSLRNIDMVVFV